MEASVSLEYSSVRFLIHLKLLLLLESLSFPAKWNYIHNWDISSPGGDMKSSASLQLLSRIVSTRQVNSYQHINFYSELAAIIKTRFQSDLVIRFTGSVRIPLQITKCNHGANSTYLSMNSFNNNTLTVPGATDETAITTPDNLLLQPTTNTATQHWTRNLNGNSQRSLSQSWRANKASLSLNLSDTSRVTNQNTTDDELTPVNANNGQKAAQSPFDYQTRYRKTWI